MASLSKFILLLMVTEEQQDFELIKAGFPPVISFCISADVLKIVPERVSVERIIKKGSETKGILGFAPFSHRIV